MLADSHPLGNILYRKWHQYDMLWGETRQLEDYCVCGAPFGGPVALMSTNRKSNEGVEDMKEKILICTSAGYQLAKISWEDENKIAGMGWTDQELLLTVSDNGGVRVFDINGKQLTQFSLLDANSAAIMLVECHFWGDGIAAISSESHIYVVEGISIQELLSKGPRRIYTLRTGLGRDRSYTSMAIVPPKLTGSGKLEVLIGTSDNSVIVVYDSQPKNVTEDQQLQTKIDAPIVKIAVAPNGRFLACYRADGILTVMSAAFTTKVLDFDAKSVAPPREIAWCGEDSVVMQWLNTGIVMVGPFGDWLNFPYDHAIHLVPESDCCRIITGSACELLQRIPAATVGINSVGSTEPAALMFDAMEAFEEGDPKADENIRSIAVANQLPEAVQSCIQAAAGEFDIAQQQNLLKAASYGKAFCPDVDPSEFVETARKLRVLNEVRRPVIGIPLTMQQFDMLTAEVLVARLVTRQHHFLALRVCDLLKVRRDGVLIHWASEKVRKMAATNASDDEINDVVRKQLDSQQSHVSVLRIAESAYRMGRRRLATLLLNQEQNARDQIPLLLQMNEEALALEKAIASEDTDLIYYTLIRLEERIVQARGNSVDYFYRIIHNHPEAANLLKLYQQNKVTADDRTSLHRLLVYSKNYQEAGIAAVNQAFQQRTPATKVQFLREGSNLYAQAKECAFFKAITDDELELMEVQRNLEMRLQLANRTQFINLTVMETLEKLIYLALDDELELRTSDAEVSKIVKRFRVSEKALWHLKIRCYSERGNWEMLDRLAMEKKSPIGYIPFARACIEYDLPVPEIEHYVEKINNLEDKYNLFMELRSFRKAVDVAAKLRDPDRLTDIGRACNDQALERYIHEVLAKL